MTTKGVVAGVSVPVLTGGAGAGIAYGIKNRNNKEEKSQDSDVEAEHKVIPPVAPSPEGAPERLSNQQYQVPVTTPEKKILKVGAQDSYIQEISKSFSIDKDVVLDRLKTVCNSYSPSNIDSLISDAVNTTTAGKEQMKEILEGEKPHWSGLDVGDVCIVVKLALSKDAYLQKARQMGAKEANIVLTSAKDICLANTFESDKQKPLSDLFSELEKSIGVKNVNKATYENILKELNAEWNGASNIGTICKSINSIFQT